MKNQSVSLITKSIRTGSFAVAMALGVLASQNSYAQSTTVPFTGYIPSPIGTNTTPAVLIIFSGTMTTGYTASLLKDTNFGPYDGADDTLIAILNSSDISLPSLHLSSTLGIFGFDGDGLSSFNGGIVFGPTRYEGPRTSFLNYSITDGFRTGDVDFIGGLAPGEHTYFSLEQNLASATGGPLIITVPGAVPEPSTYGLFGAVALLVIAAFRRRIVK